ncbi:MAG: hypothetical protein JSU66_16245 [Deltaproteobacteria bacterium]|nr:MAG: hypothetical protein JSU66_16245 [Deltaproteobacteria bacterium]
MRRRVDVVVPALLALGTALWWASFIDIGFELTDEGIANLSGSRVLRGQRPFADFFLFYFPGFALWIAGWFALLGETALSARIGWATFAVARSVLAYAVARRLAPPGVAAAAGVVAIALPGPSWKVQVATLFLLGLWVSLRYAERPGAARAAAAGAAAGFAAWFRWDTAATTAVLLSGFALADALAQRERTRARLVDVATFAAAGFAIVAPGLLYLLTTPGALDGALEHFSYHARSLDAFALPWPSPLPGAADPPADVAEALRRALYALPIAGFIALPLARFGPAGRRGPALAVWFAGAVAYALAVRRPDPSHFVQVLPVALLPLLALRPARRAGRALAALLLALGCAGLVCEAGVRAGARRPTPRLAFDPTLARVDVPRAGLRAPRAQAREIEAVVAAIRARTEPGDGIAVLPAEALVVFFAGREPALRYDAVYPVLLDDPERQRATAEALAEARLVLLRPTSSGFAGPGSPPLPAYAPELWRVIREDFRVAGAVGRFVIYERRRRAEAPAPPD